MRRRIKNEIIAQYSDEKNKDFKISRDISGTINRYIISHLSSLYNNHASRQTEAASHRGISTEYDTASAAGLCSW